MRYTLRDYQQRASDSAIRFFGERGKENALIVLPTGAGKSLVVADIAQRLNSNVLVFCPSKEILQQNYDKMCSYGEECSMYSASVGRKEISKITFATIGSAKSHKEDFECFEYIIIDEAHLVNPSHGMYKDFIKAVPRKILGLTATPYRLCSYQNFGAMLKFITRTRPRVFERVIYHEQVGALLERGYLARLNYYSLVHPSWKTTNLEVNTTGADYTDKSVREEYSRIDFYSYLLSIVRRLLHPKSGVPRRGILVFTRFVKEAEDLTYFIPNCAMVTGDTPKREREDILKRFKSGEIHVVANVNCLAVGFDYPELDTIVMAKPTMSLAQWYQIVGRAIRPSENKEGWIVDLCGTYERFGKVEDLELVDKTGRGQWVIQSNGKELTNTFFT